jgi:hypothetical protein
VLLTAANRGDGVWGRECLGSADGGTRGRGGQRFWGRGAGAGGEGATRRWGRGRRCGAVGEGAVPDAVSGEGEMVRRVAILGRRAPRGGAVVAWWESAVGAGRGRRQDLGVRVLCLGQLTGGPSSYSSAREAERETGLLERGKVARFIYRRIV